MNGPRTYTVDSTSETDPEISRLREGIRELDRTLLRVLERRREHARLLGHRKRSLGRPVQDPAQEATVVRRAAEGARELGMDETLVRKIFWWIVGLSREVQREESP